MERPGKRARGLAIVHAAPALVLAVGARAMSALLPQGIVVNPAT
jgi:hypothetical protein